MSTLFSRGPNQVLVPGIPRRHRQGDFVLVVIRLEVIAQAHKAGHVVVFQRGAVRTRFGVHVHAQSLVHPHVEVDVAVGAARVPILQATDSQFERLLIEPTLVRRTHVDFTDDPRWGHVRHGLPVAILFDVDGADVERRRRGIVRLHLLRTRQGIEVPTPLSPRIKLQTGKPEGYGLGPALS